MMLRISQLTVTYDAKKTPIKALESVDLTVSSGEILAIIGPSGCGKSTLLSVVGGIIRGYEGKMTLNDKPIDYKTFHVGYVPQHYGLLPWKTVWQNCTLPYTLKKRTITPDILEVIDKQLIGLGIETLKKRYPITLSGGQCQRVALGRAFALPPDLLLLDEAFGALDAITKDEAIQTFLSVWQQHKCTTLLVTHNIDEALYLGHRIVVMHPNPGRIVSCLDNPLAGYAAYRTDRRYEFYYERIKAAIRKEQET